MRVRLLKPWQYRKVGSILAAVPDGTANLLIKRKVAELVQDEPKYEPKVKRVRPGLSAS